MEGSRNAEHTANTLVFNLKNTVFVGQTDQSVSLFRAHLLVEAPAKKQRVDHLPACLTWNIFTPVDTTEITNCRGRCGMKTFTTHQRFSWQSSATFLYYISLVFLFSFRFIILFNGTILMFAWSFCLLFDVHNNKRHLFIFLNFVVHQLGFTVLMNWKMAFNSVQLYPLSLIWISGCCSCWERQVGGGELGGGVRVCECVRTSTSKTNP